MAFERLQAMQSVWVCVYVYKYGFTCVRLGKNHFIFFVFFLASPLSLSLCKTSFTLPPPFYRLNCQPIWIAVLYYQPEKRFACMLFQNRNGLHEEITSVTIPYI